MNKAVFLDRDGVINEDSGYVHKIEDFKLYPDVLEALKLLNDFKLFIVTNQSGIGRGYYSEEDFHKFNNHLLNELKKEGIEIGESYFCPHHPDKSCDCRKPNIKFIKEAEKKYNINPKESWVIGDHPHDIEFGKNAGCKAVYLLRCHGEKHRKELKVKPDGITMTLLEASNFILSNGKIISQHGMPELMQDLKKQNKKIVTCNGTFDILHIGHIKFLKEAKKQGDILIVGINSDKSVKENKGPDRPINNEKNRAETLAALECVDYVIIFDEKTPIKLLEKIKPDIHANGEEYGRDCIEAPTVKKHGGKIHLIKNYGGFSTTKLIENIKKVYK